MTLVDYIKTDPRGYNTIGFLTTAASPGGFETLLGTLDGDCQWPAFGALTGTLDVDGHWHWDDTGDPTDHNGNRVFNLEAYRGSDDDVSKVLIG